MSDPTPQHDGLDLSMIGDPDVRRALRAMHQHMTETLSRQQMEIDALLEIMMERSVGSLSDFKRHLVRLQQDRARCQRIHMAIDAAAHPAPTAPGSAAPGTHAPAR